jgi:hypothetical protein
VLLCRVNQDGGKRENHPCHYPHPSKEEDSGMNFHTCAGGIGAMIIILETGDENYRNVNEKAKGCFMAEWRIRLWRENYEP